MAERQSRPNPFAGRPEYSLDARNSYELFHAAQETLYDTVLNTIPTRSSRVSAEVTRDMTHQVVRASHHGPLYGDESQLLFSEEENGERAVLLFEPLSFDSFAKIALTNYHKGPRLSEALVSIRDFPPGSRDPLVVQYLLEEYRCGGYTTLVTESMPALESKEGVVLDERPMTRYDYVQLAIAIERIHSMRLSDQPALGVSSLERL